MKNNEDIYQHNPTKFCRIDDKNIRYVNKLLGHGSSKTTEIYTYVTNKSIQKIKSPFDELEIE